MVTNHIFKDAHVFPIIQYLFDLNANRPSERLSERTVIKICKRLFKRILEKLKKRNKQLF